MNSPGSDPPRDRLRVCILTPPGAGAVATVRVEGEDALTTVAGMFQPAGARKLERVSRGRIVYGRWRDESGEEVVVCRRGLHGVEIHCHGGASAARAIVNDLSSRGATATDWRRWVALAEDDPIRAAARIALAKAPSSRTAAILLDQYEGALQRELDRVVAATSANHLAEAGRMAERLLELSHVGMHLTEPFRVVLAGRPNVGKSSLINRIVGYERAIVFDTPGTTRDAVRVGTCLDGWPVELTDTAGLRDSADPLEAAGVERARTLLSTADSVVLVFDAADQWTDDDEKLLRRHSRALLAHNKCDLTCGGATDRPPGHNVSARTSQGVEALIGAIAGRLVPHPPPPGAAVPFLAEHVEMLNRAQSALYNNDHGAAFAALAEHGRRRGCR